MKKQIWMAALLLCSIFWIGSSVKAYAAENQAAAPPVALMQVERRVNARTGPATTYSVVGRLSAGQQVYSMGISPNGWHFVNLNGNAVYVSGNYLKAVDPAAAANLMILPEGFGVPGWVPASSPVSAAADSGAAAVPPAAPAPVHIPAVQSAPGPNPDGTWPGAPIVFIGDSRFVLMEQEVNAVAGSNPWAWVAEGGRGYDWFVETGLPRADAAIGTGTKVVINLGVNDVRNVEKYLTLWNQKAAEWTVRGAVVYFSSVNPVWTNPYVTQEQVEAFNLRMQTGLAPYVHWLDSYHYIQANGCRIVDGLHYDQATSLKLYDYYLRMVTA